MATKRRRRKSNNDLAPVILLVVGILVVLWLVRELALHPVIVVVLLVVAAGGIALGIVLWLRRRGQRAIAARLRLTQSYEVARYHAMGPKAFEHALALLCTRDGCTAVQVVGGAGDLGADVIAMAPDGRRIVLQAKRYGPTNKVHGPDLQRFGGTCFSVHRAAVAAVVTTSTFTKQAKEYATHMGIHLFDEQRLAAWASRTGPAPWH